MFQTTCLPPTPCCVKATCLVRRDRMICNTHSQGTYDTFVCVPYAARCVMWISVSLHGEQCGHFDVKDLVSLHHFSLSHLQWFSHCGGCLTNFLVLLIPFFRRKLVDISLKPPSVLTAWLSKPYSKRERFPIIQIASMQLLPLLSQHDCWTGCSVFQDFGFAFN